MQSGDGIDRENDWLLQRRADGLSQQTIADLIGSTQETVSRNLKAVDGGGQMSRDVRRKIRWRLSRLEAEAEAKRRAEVDRENARLEDEANREKRRLKEEANRARLQSAKRKWDGLKEALKKRERERLEQLRLVNERLTDRGIDVGHNKTHGDGVRILCTLEPFHHLDEGAELVAFSPEDHPFSSGQTAGELRKDVSYRLRMQKKAVPDDAIWPPMIGRRRSDLITRQPDPDERWFWGRHSDLIARWRDLRSFTSTWRSAGRLPRLPSDIDVSWLEELIRIERQIIDAGLTFEDSILGWRDAWAVEAEVSEEALLQHLHRRALVRQVLSASVVIVAGIVAGIVRGIVRVVVDHPRPVMAVAACIAIFLLRDIIAEIALWLWSGGVAFLGGVAGKIGDIIDAIARSIDNTKRTIGEGYDATVAFLKSAHFLVFVIIIFSSLTLFSLYSSQSQRVWTNFIAILSITVILVALFIALIRHTPQHSKVFGF